MPSTTRAKRERDDYPGDDHDGMMDEDDTSNQEPPPQRQRTNDQQAQGGGGGGDSPPLLPSPAIPLPPATTTRPAPSAQQQHQQQQGGRQGIPLRQQFRNLAGFTLMAHPVTESQMPIQPRPFTESPSSAGSSRMHEHLDEDADDEMDTAQPPAPAEQGQSEEGSQDIPVYSRFPGGSRTAQAYIDNSGLGVLNRNPQMPDGYSWREQAAYWREQAIRRDADRMHLITRINEELITNRTLLDQFQAVPPDILEATRQNGQLSHQNDQLTRRHEALQNAHAQLQRDNETLKADNSTKEAYIQKLQHDNAVLYAEVQKYKDAFVGMMNKRSSGTKYWEHPGHKGHSGGPGGGAGGAGHGAGGSGGGMGGLEA